MASREGLKPINQLMNQKAREISTEGWRGDEIASRAHMQLTTAISAVLRVVQGPFHEGGEGHPLAMLLQSLPQPFGAGHIKGLHVVRMACTRSKSWVSKQ